MYLVLSELTSSHIFGKSFKQYCIISSVWNGSWILGQKGLLWDADRPPEARIASLATVLFMIRKTRISASSDSLWEQRVRLDGEDKCFVDRASLYNLVNSNNSIIYVRNLLRFYHISISDTFHFMTYALVILTIHLFRNNKYQVSHKHSCSFWWRERSRPKHVEIDKYTNK